jgi:hypothetical protein
MIKTLIGAALLWSLSACALGPVETDPVKADQRAASMRADCFSRGGTWSEQSRTCVGADPKR